MLLGSAVFSYISTVNQPQSGQSIGLRDLVILNAYHSDGKLFYSFTGHNSLTEFAATVLTECALGATLSQTNYYTQGATCSPIISSLWINPGPLTAPVTSSFQANPASCAQGAGNANCETTMANLNTATSLPTLATSYPSPLPSTVCDPNTQSCFGWNSTATFDMTGWTSSYNVLSAGAGWIQQCSLISISGCAIFLMSPFDYINLCTAPNVPSGCQGSALTLSPGDRLSLTIAFTVSGVD